MAKPICNSHTTLLTFHFILFTLVLAHASAQLHPSQNQALLRIQELLNYYPSYWTDDATTDFCNSDPNPAAAVACFEGNVTQLHISGTNNQTLHQSFSSDSLFDALAGLPSLKVLSMVSLGLWGPLPPNIGALSSLEILNVSSNQFKGSIPVEVSTLKSLQTLILDHNLFAGRVPYWIGTLPVLSVLSLRGNSLQGNLPSSISSMKSLRVLSLAKNHLYGEMPDLHRLTNLQVLDLEDNYLGPSFPKLSNKLVSIVVRRNRFGLSIPANLTSFFQLERLDVSQNSLVGPLDPKLLVLPSVKYLDISQNKLTGLLFENMSCNAELVFVNLSSNLLTGDLPSCLKADSEKVEVSFAENCLSTGGSEQFPPSYCLIQALAVEIPRGMHKKKRTYNRTAAAIALSTVGAVSIGLTIMLGLLFRRTYARKKLEEPKTRWIKEKNYSTASTAKQLLDAKHITEIVKLGSHGLPAYRAFSLEELTEATNSFDALSIIGEDSHGQIYRGRLADGTQVAIRSLQMRKRQNAQCYTHHIEMLAKLRHPHLVSSLGHCFEFHPEETNISRTLLVFEFVPNGTLRNSISGRKLNWVQRMAAAIGITKGLQFLHTGFAPGIWGNDLKIEHILLDQDFHAKLSNYNLALFDETSNIKMDRSPYSKRTTKSTRVHGDAKSDVYDFGVVLLEIIVGRPIISQDDISISREILQSSLNSDDTSRRSIVDPSIYQEPTNESLKTLISLCIKCLSAVPADRPSVEDVLWNLQFAAQIEESWKANSPLIL